MRRKYPSHSYPENRAALYAFLAGISISSALWATFTGLGPVSLTGGIAAFGLMILTLHKLDQVT